jgi:hypothetical protein
MVGLCRIGAAGKPAAAPLLQMLKARGFLNSASFYPQAIQTLVGLGVDPEEIWASQDFDGPHMQRADFDHEVSVARTIRPCRR